MAQKKDPDDREPAGEFVKQQREAADQKIDGRLEIIFNLGPELIGQKRGDGHTKDDADLMAPEGQSQDEPQGREPLRFVVENDARRQRERQGSQQEHNWKAGGEVKRSPDELLPGQDVEQSGNAGEPERKGLLDEEKLEAQEERERQKSGELGQEYGIPEQFEKDRHVMLGKAALEKGAVKIEGRLPALGDMLSHQGGDGLVAVHQPETVGQEGDMNEAAESHDDAERGGVPFPVRRQAMFPDLAHWNKRRPLTKARGMNAQRGERGIGFRAGKLSLNQRQTKAR